MLCDDCHGQVHALICEKDLADYFSTISNLSAHSGVSKFVKWVQNKKPGVRHRKKNGKN